MSSLEVQRWHLNARLLNVQHWHFYTGLQGQLRVDVFRCPVNLRHRGLSIPAFTLRAPK